MAPVNYPTVLRPRGTRRGFLLVTVLVLLSVISIFCVSMLSAVTFEKRMARRAAAVAELKMNTDVLLNYVGSQVSNNPLLLLKAPLDLRLPPTGRDEFFKGGTDATSFALNGEGFREVIATPLTEIKNTKVGDPYAPKFLIDPSYPINERDKLAGQSVGRDLCMVAVKSSVRDPMNPGKAITEYAAMVLERREVPLFNYLAFFDVARFRVSNPGSQIILDGPIQSNKGIHFEASKGQSKVYVDSTLHTPGVFSAGGNELDKDQFMITDGTKRVSMLNSSNRLRQTSDDINPGADKRYYTSDDKVVGNSFANFMTTTTKGFLRTGAVGETTVILDGLNYVDDTVVPVLDANGNPTYDPSGNPLTKANPDTANSDFWISNNRRIDPPNPALREDTSGKYLDAQTAETVKTAYDAKLYVYVEKNGTLTVFNSQANAEAYKNVKTDDGRVAWKTANRSKYVAPSSVASFVTLPTVVRYADGTGAAYVTGTKTDLAVGAIFDAQQKSTVAMVDLNMGSLNTLLKTGGLPMADGSVWNTKVEGGWNGVLYVDVQDPASRPMAPVMDYKTKQYVDPVSKLPSALVTADSALKVELPSLNITSTAQDWSSGSTLTDKTGLTAVRIKNATTIPGALVGDPGFTLATNTATYSVGSINADGVLSTGTTSLQDGQKTNSDSPLAADGKVAIPSAIFSDKHIVLSDDFREQTYDLRLYVPKPSKVGTLSKLIYDNWPFTGQTPENSTYKLDGKGNGHYQYQDHPGNRGGASTRVMELSSGFIIGDDESSNKGIHTMLSFLQPFHKSDDVLRMRGSIIGIYKARYFKGAAGSFNDYYTAPARTYGYSSLYRGGLMPPSSPSTSSFRRMRQFPISKEDYEYLKSRTEALIGKSTGESTGVKKEITSATARRVFDLWLERIGTR